MIYFNFQHRLLYLTKNDKLKLKEIRMSKITDVKQLKELCLYLITPFQCVSNAI